MEDEDLEDTIVGMSGTRGAPHDLIDSDTIIAPHRRQGSPALVSAPAGSPAQPGRLPYRIRVGSQDPIPLDAPVYIGRAPVSPRIVSGAVPRLVRVPSPHQEVSGTHIAVQQTGYSVVVTDCKSTNATLVLVPGAAPLKLRQGESVVVTPGTVVDIGDGNRVEILPMQRLT
jgi:hypothetical protein